MFDQLAGKYPKSFKFTGWHPQCRCTMLPITIGTDELGDLMEAQENGEEFVSKNTVTELPENFNQWYNANKDRFNANNEPWFLSENKEMIISKEPALWQIKQDDPTQVETISEEWKKKIEMLKKDEKDETPDNQFAKVIDVFKDKSVAKKEVKYLAKELTEKEIIDKISGLDSIGCCASLAYTYMANKIGYDVLDFRGGDSADIVASKSKMIARTGGKEFIGSTVKDVVTQAFAYVQEGEEVVLSAGRHAAIIRKKEGQMQYLELQDYKENNQYYPLNVQELRKRFRLKKQKGYGSPSARIIKAEDIRKNLKSFKEFLAYINTSESEQKKIVASAPPGYLHFPQSLR